MVVMWLRSLFSRIYCSVWLWIRPIVKWLLRRTTRLCELQRICYATLPGAQRTLGVESSLEQTRMPELRKCCKYLDAKAADQQILPDVTCYAVYAVVRLKEVNTKLHPRFSGQLLSCVGGIWGYRQLLAAVEGLRLTKCGKGEATEAVNSKLQQLWGALKPDTELDSLISKQWQEIGFQGDDPCTDFRGMGLLGLENLLYFATNHQSAARHVLSRSCHPQYGYSFAIVGINLTLLTHTLLTDGSLKAHFYNTAVKDMMPGKTNTTKGVRMPNMRQFHQVYCHVFFAFDMLWRNEKPKDIMEFNKVRNKFEKQFRAQLASLDVILKTNFVLENV